MRPNPNTGHGGTKEKVKLCFRYLNRKSTSAIHQLQYMYMQDKTLMWPNYIFHEPDWPVNILNTNGQWARPSLCTFILKTKHYGVWGSGSRYYRRRSIGSKLPVVSVSTAAMVVIIPWTIRQLTCIELIGSPNSSAQRSPPPLCICEIDKINSQPMHKLL